MFGRNYNYVMLPLKVIVYSVSQVTLTVTRSQCCLLSSDCFEVFPQTEFHLL